MLSLQALRQVNHLGSIANRTVRHPHIVHRQCTRFHPSSIQPNRAFIETISRPYSQGMCMAASARGMMDRLPMILSYRSSHRAKNAGWFSLFGWMGGAMLAKSLLENEGRLVGAVYAQEENGKAEERRDKIDISQTDAHRAAAYASLVDPTPLELLPNNPDNGYIGPNTIQEWGALGFKLDPYRKTPTGEPVYFLDGPDYQTEGNKDPLHKDHPNNFFRAEIENGRLIWNSYTKVNIHDVAGIAQFYKKLYARDGIKRSLVVNSGVHGNRDGTVKTGPDSMRLVLIDLRLFTNRCEYYVHWISNPAKGPIHPNRRPQVDFLNSYCYSAATKEFTDLYVPDTDATLGESFLKLMGARSIGYSCDKLIYDGANSYVELGTMKQDIRNKLDKHSVCYVEGIGGLGKSRVALEIEREIRASMGSDDANNSNYFTTVFVPLSDPDRKSFLDHAKGVVGQKESNDVLLEEYFGQIVFAAKAVGKKVFVIVDNVDTFSDFRQFKMIYDVLKKSRIDGINPIFTLLVTGRSQLLKSFEDHNADATVEIKNYCKDHMWELFENKFISSFPPDKREIAQKLMNKNLIKQELKNLMEKYDYHPGHTINLARYCAGGILLRGVPAEDFLDFVQNQFGKVVGGKNLSQTLDIMLNSLNKDFGSIASQIYEVVILTSEGFINGGFLGSVLDKCFPTDDSQAVLTRLLEYGMIERDGKKGVSSSSIPAESQLTPPADNTGPEIKVDVVYFRVPCFYHELMRSKISARYQQCAAAPQDIQLQSYQKYIDSIFSNVLDIIECNLKDEKKSNVIEENMVYLLNLSNYTKGLSVQASDMYQEISKRARQHAVNHLSTVPYVDALGKYNHFLSDIPNVPGYSIETALYKRMKMQKLDSMAENIMQKLKNHTDRNNDLWLKDLQSLSNIYVFKRVSISEGDDDSKFNDIRETLKSNLKKAEKKDKKTEIVIKSNIDLELSLEELKVFPQIKFHEVTSKQREKAKKWAEADSKGPSTHRVDLRGKGIYEGLRLLIPYLMEERKTKVEEIDLSHNSLGNTDKETLAVGDLLKYPGSPKVWHLNDNYLSNCEKDRFFNIIDGIKNCFSLETLFINNNGLTDDHVQQLGEALKDHSKIKYIDLSGNSFGDNGIRCLVNLMCENRNIQKINVVNGSWLFPSHDVQCIYRKEKDVIVVSGLRSKL